MTYDPHVPYVAESQAAGDWSDYCGMPWGICCMYRHWMQP